MRAPNPNPEIETVLRLSDDLTVPIVIQIARGCSGVFYAVSINGIRKATGECITLDEVRESLPCGNNGNG